MSRCSPFIAPEVVRIDLPQHEHCNGCEECLVHRCPECRRKLVMLPPIEGVRRASRRHVGEAKVEPSARLVAILAGQRW